MKGSTNERRKLVDLKPSHHAGFDLSIPDSHDHEKHLNDVLRSSPRGFPFGERRPS